MQTLKQKVSSLLPGSGARPGSAATAVTRRPSEKNVCSSAFLSGSPRTVADRKIFLHQEGVAALVQDYVSAALKAVEDLATAHAILSRGLRQAGDLVVPVWAERTMRLASNLNDLGQASMGRLGESFQGLQEARRQHREAAKAGAEATKVARRYQHYAEKVGKLRVEADEAKAGLGSSALDPTAQSPSSFSRRSQTGLRTMQADLKIGRLVRNEEKLHIIAEHKEAAEAAASQALEFALTVGRRRLRLVMDVLLKRTIEELLPGIQAACEASAAPPAASKGSSAAAADRQASGYGPALGNAQQALCALACGDRVIISGLSGSPQYNGKEASVKSFRQDGRVEVFIRPGMGEVEGKVLALRVENLTQCAAASDDLVGAATQLLGLTDLGVNCDDSSDEGNG